MPRPSIDTGMGLERIVAVLQGKHDNYDIDLMRALIEASADVSSTDADGLHNTSHRVVADHLRSAGFLIADGVLPSNEGGLCPAADYAPCDATSASAGLCGPCDVPFGAVARPRNGDIPEPVCGNSCH